MKRITFILFPLLLSHTIIAQQRIGIDVGTRLTNVNLTVSYNKVFKQNFLYSFGLFGGTFGNSYIEYDTLSIYASNVNPSPFDKVSENIHIDSSDYKLLAYDGRARGLGIQLGIGYFLEFGVTHGLRIHVNQRFGCASQKVGGWYRSTDYYSTIRSENNAFHWFAGTTFELYHTVRMSGRNTFYYGVKIPTYYSLDKDQFHPINQKDILYGFEPELALGFTRVVGKCD